MRTMGKRWVKGNKSVRGLQKPKDYLISWCRQGLSFFLCLTQTFFNYHSLVWAGDLSWGEKGNLPLVCCCSKFLPAFLDWECPMLEENLLCKNSTLLDTSKAVPIQKALQFSNLSAVLGKFHILFPHITRGNPCLYWKSKVLFLLNDF